MRPREYQSLRWPAVDFETNEIHVRRTVSFARSHDEVGPVRPKVFSPKTKAGIRDIPMDAQLALMLKKWKLQCPKSENDLVFPREDGSGQPIHRSNIRRMLLATLKRAGVRIVKLYSLRHYFASAMITNGALITEVSARMGHANIGITQKVYVHWLKDRKSDAISKLTSSLLQPTGYFVDSSGVSGR
jgi:integrase